MSDKPKIDDGGPAFPVECEFAQDGKVRGLQTGNYSGWETGMTLRDFFAANALQGIIAHPGMHPDDCHQPGTAELAYDFARAMLAARSK